MEEKDKSIKSNYRLTTYDELKKSTYTPGTWSPGSWQFSEPLGNIEFVSGTRIITSPSTIITTPDIASSTGIPYHYTTTSGIDAPWEEEVLPPKEEPEFINKLEGEYITAS